MNAGTPEVAGTVAVGTGVGGAPGAAWSASASAAGALAEGAIAAAASADSVALLAAVVAAASGDGASASDAQPDPTAPRSAIPTAHPRIAMARAYPVRTRPPLVYARSPMLLNAVEKALINNPVRAAVQRLEARRLRWLGGPMHGGRALEIGCGRGVGVEVILDQFHADAVDAFDLDPGMIAEARRRLAPRGDRVRLWVGDAEYIEADDASYDAVFDFGIVHHVPRWRTAIAEVARVLRPGGRFYAEEVLAKFIHHPLWRRLLDHPMDDRFDRATFARALEDAGLDVLESMELFGDFAWFVAVRR